MQKFLVAAVISALLTGSMAGCRSTKKIQHAIATTNIRKDTTGDAARAAAAPPRDAHADSMEVIRQAVAGLSHNRIDFQTFSAHMHVHYEGGDGKGSEFNAVVRIKKDSMIWVSINARRAAVGKGSSPRIFPTPGTPRNVTAAPLSPRGMSLPLLCRGKYLG